MTYWISMGSNMDPEKHVPRAARLIKESTGRLSSSPVYITAPIGSTEQDPYRNAVWAIQTKQSPEELQFRLSEIENSCGRVRDPQDKYASRTMDLDLLGYDQTILEREEIGRRIYLHRGIIVLDPSMEPLLPLLEKNAEGAVLGRDKNLDHKINQIIKEG